MTLELEGTWISVKMRTVESYPASMVPKCSSTIDRLDISSSTRQFHRKTLNIRKTLCIFVPARDSSAVERTASSGKHAALRMLRVARLRLVSVASCSGTSRLRLVSVASCSGTSRLRLVSVASCFETSSSLCCCCCKVASCFGCFHFDHDKPLPFGHMTTFNAHTHTHTQTG